MDSSSSEEPLECDVLIVGSGPIGCAFARVLIESEIRHTLKKIVMIDAGQQFSIRPGENVKNSFYYSRNPNQFSSIVQGSAQLISVTPDQESLPYPLLPIATIPNAPDYGINNINKNQRTDVNIPAASTTYAVGGMTTHWTCCTPRTELTFERPKEEECGISNEDWDILYEQGERYFKTSTTIFESSIRHQVLRSRLEALYGERVAPMPLAGYLNPETKLVTWSGADTVLGENIVDELGPKGIKRTLYEKGEFDIKQQTRCTKLYWEEINQDNGSKSKIITKALVRDLQTHKDYLIEAKVYIIACNPILTPQLLWNSDIRPVALGRYLCDQPMTFCQVVLSDDIMKEIGEKVSSTNNSNQSSKDISIKEEKDSPIYEITVPLHDPPPAILLKVTEKYPWHVQIHKDIFSYGKLPANMDPRLILDIRYFARVQPRFENYVTFEDELKDLMGLPQPTFHFKLESEEKNEILLMMKEMTEVALSLGAFLPGVEPRMLPLGTALHFQGTHRMGVNPEISVTNNNSLVWGFNNLYLGGNGSIPTATACNPTLTSVAIAIRSANYMIEINKIV